MRVERAERRDRLGAPDMQGQFSSFGRRAKDVRHGWHDRIAQI